METVHGRRNPSDRDLMERGGLLKRDHSVDDVPNEFFTIRESGFWSAGFPNVLSEGLV